jgi:hypothetical protein
VKVNYIPFWLTTETFPFVKISIELSNDGLLVNRHEVQELSTGPYSHTSSIFITARIHPNNTDTALQNR